MGTRRLPDGLWAVVEPLRPEPPPPSRGGRPLVAQRRVTEAIWFVRRTGCPWRALNATSFCSSATAERRFREWRRAGVFERLHERCLEVAEAAGTVDWSFLAVDGCHVKAPLSRTEKGGRRGSTGASRARTGRPSSTGLVLAILVESGDRHDLPPAREALADLHVPSYPTPGLFAADGAFDDRAFRAGVEALGFTADIPRNPRKTAGPKHKGFVPGRWVVERTHAHRGAFRSIRTRWSRKLDCFEAFLATAAAHYIVRAVRL
jgi:transposase